METGLFFKLMQIKAVLAVLIFCHAHPFVVGGALVSLFGMLHDRLAKLPEPWGSRLSAVAHIARSMGVNWSGIVDGAVRFMTGLPNAAATKLPPMAVFMIAGVLGFGALGCHSAVAPKTADAARQEARAAVVTVDAAWMALAKVCTDTAAATNDEQYLGECAAVLDPIRISLLAMCDTINAWGNATSNAPLACKVSKTASDLADACAVLGAPPAVQTAVKDAVEVANALGGCAVDGGAK